MPATDQQLSDAARDAILDTLETGEKYDVDGVVIERDLTHLKEFQDWVDSRNAARRPAFTKLRVAR